MLRGFDALAVLCDEKGNGKRAGGMDLHWSTQLVPPAGFGGEKMLTISNDHHHQSSISYIFHKTGPYITQATANIVADLSVEHETLIFFR